MNESTKRWLAFAVVTFAMQMLPLSVAAWTKAVPQESVQAEQHSVGFESSPSGPFSELTTSLGTWKAVQGTIQIDQEHARSGKQCLQIAGESAVLELTLAEELKTDGKLIFWSERWTARQPFKFRIEKLSSRTWTEIYNGDQQIRVGRGFLSEVKVRLADPTTTKLRFSASSPPNTGILIDDMRFVAARPMKITAVEPVAMTLPALIGTERSAFAKLKVSVSGELNPISVTEIQAAVDQASRSLVTSFQPFFVSNDSNFRWDTPLGTARHTQRKTQQYNVAPFRCQQTLVDGDNYIWLAGELDPKSDIDQTIVAKFESISFSNGDSQTIDDKGSTQRMGVAVRKSKDDGIDTYRIPGLVTTNQGTLIGVYDIRHDGSGDLPGNIDVGMSRSTDGGRTWESMQTIMDMGDDPKWNHDGIGDPAILVDRKTGTIWVSATWSHGNRSWRGSGPGLEPEETGQWMMVKSDDDGMTWSDPINVTKQIKKPEWSFLLQGPGKGITMSDGTLVFPAQFQDPPNETDSAAHRLPHSTLIFSRDHGATWNVGTAAWDDTTEAQIVELSDGQLMLNARYNRESTRVVVTSRDLGSTWQTHHTSISDLIEPRACMASLINVGRELGWRDLSGFNDQFLLFSNPHSLSGRNHMTIQASRDSGTTWPEPFRLLLDEQTGRGYSCMSMIDAETVGILYEGSQADLTFQRIKIADILNPPQE